MALSLEETKQVVEIILKNLRGTSKTILADQYGMAYRVLKGRIQGFKRNHPEDYQKIQRKALGIKTDERGSFSIPRRIKEQIIKMAEMGHTSKYIGNEFGLPIRTVRKLIPFSKKEFFERKKHIPLMLYEMGASPLNIAEMLEVRRPIIDNIIQSSSLWKPRRRSTRVFPVRKGYKLPSLKALEIFYGIKVKGKNMTEQLESQAGYTGLRDALVNLGLWAEVQQIRKDRMKKGRNKEEKGPQQSHVVDWLKSALRRVDRTKILQLYYAGKSTEEIAALGGFDPRTVMIFLVCHNMTEETPNNPRWTRERLRELLFRYRKGESLQELAAAQECSTGTVKQRLLETAYADGFDWEKLQSDNRRSRKKTH